MDYNSDGFVVKLVVDKKELDDIFTDLVNAQEVINQCYFRLKELGAIVIKEKEVISGN